MIERSTSYFKRADSAFAQLPFYVSFLASAAKSRLWEACVYRLSGRTVSVSCPRVNTCSAWRDFSSLSGENSIQGA